MVGDLALMLTDRVTIYAPGVRTNNAGQQTQDWSDPLLVGEYPAAVQGQTGVERVDARDAAIAKLRVYLSVDAVVDRTSRMDWRGQWLEVVGIPRMVYDLLRGTPHHYELDVKEVQG